MENISLNEELDNEDFEEPALWEMGNLCFVPVEDESKLMQLIDYDTSFSYKDRIVFLAGHFPLHYNNNEAYAATDAWGAFTPYSLDLACKIASHHNEHAQISQRNRDLRKESTKLPKVVVNRLYLNQTPTKITSVDQKYIWSGPRKVGFILLADDINYEDFGENAEFGKYQKSSRRNAFYREMSGEDAQLPIEFQEIFDRYGISTDSVIRQDHGKKGREDCLFFSERILRASRQDTDTECAKSYRGLIESQYFDSETDYLVSFLPDSCTSNICEKVLDERWGMGDWQFKASHVAMQTDGMFLPWSDKESIWKKWGVKYRRDNLAI